MERPPTATDTQAVAYTLQRKGWNPLPLPAGKKTPPPEGFTGYRGRDVTPVDIERWDWTGNIAIRMPDDVIGIDVDMYKGGDLAPMTKAIGVELPPTKWSTSRRDGSGIAFYRVPRGTTLQANPTNAIEIIQASHRYAVTWPSVHPDSGDTYQWVDETDLETLDEPPDIDDLAELPFQWIEHLKAVKTATAASATPTDVLAFIANRQGASAPGRLKGIQTRLDNYTGSRHDTLVEVACWAMREVEAGCYPAADALNTLERWWNRVIDDPTRLDSNEFGSAIAWATAQAALDPARIAEIKASTQNTPLTVAGVQQKCPPVNVDPATGEIVQHDPKHIPDEFWNTRPTLAHIRQAAHSRTRSADAVLLFTLARVAALISPTITLPAISGSAASLNFLGGVVASSGGGKSTAGAVARELVPIKRKDVVADVPPGSGEGLTELYFEMVTEEGADGKNRKVKRQTKAGAFIYLDEGQALAEMGNRKGATLLPTLRSAWSGEVIGQSNATAETHRVLKHHSYRMSIMVGFQMEYAADLIADRAGGTPQRFVFASATDPTVPDVAPEWPGELDFSPPSGIQGGRSLDFAPEIASEVRERSLQATRGDLVPDPLDTHRDLVRMKLAALLAMLEGRTNVDLEDWALAETLMDVSSAVRSHVMLHAAAQRAEAEQNHRELMVGREEASERAAIRRAVTSGAKSIGRRVHKVGAASRRDLLSAVAGKHRQLAGGIDDMVDHAIGQGWIAESGDQYTPGIKQP